MKERRAWCTLKLFQRRHHCLWELVKILLDERGEGMVYPQIMVSGQVLSGRVWHACISYFHKYYANLGNLEMATAAIENVVLMGTNIHTWQIFVVFVSVCVSLSMVVMMMWEQSSNTSHNKVHNTLEQSDMHHRDSIRVTRAGCLPPWPLSYQNQVRKYRVGWRVPCSPVTTLQF